MALAMIICDFPVQKASFVDFNYYDSVLDILLPLGEYAQIQGEYFESRTGRLPKHRSWCFDVIRTTGSPQHLVVLETYFGREDSTSQLHVRSVFEEAGVDARYKQYAEDAYTRISTLIDALPEFSNPSGEAMLRRSIFRALLEEIHDRTD
jgi:farnesyl diphosphate synthase